MIIGKASIINIGHLDCMTIIIFNTIIFISNDQQLFNNP